MGESWLARAGGLFETRRGFFTRRPRPPARARYEYVNLDDGMVASTRAADGSLQPDPKFPRGFKALSDDLHAAGLKFGVYTDRGTTTCGGRPSAFGHEAQDAATYATW